MAGILPFLFLGTGCDSTSDDPEPFLRVSEANHSITLSSGESSRTIEVSTNTSEWTVHVSAEGRSWCTAVKEGESIVVSVEKNEGTNLRSTTITASARNVEVEITITQLGATPVLQIKEGDKAITFETFGGDAPVNITTNLPVDEWDVIFSDPTASEWCDIQKGDNQLTISVDENIGAEARTVEITITSDRIPAEQQPKISVLQFGTGYTLVVPESNNSFTAAPSNSIVTLRTNIPSGQWSYVVEETAGGWCHAEVVPTADNKDNQLKITVDENSSLEQRIAVITILSDLLPDVRPTITVTQAGIDLILRVENSMQDFAVTGREVTLDITTNLPLEELSVELSDPAASWCVPSIDGGKLKITVGANTEQAARNVTVTIKDAQRPAAPQATVVVTQELPALTIAENESIQNLEVADGEVTLNIIETNIPFGELSVTSDAAATWCNPVIENGKLKITVESNAGENTLDRQVELTISSAKLPGIEAKLTIIQLGTMPVLQIPAGSDALSFGYEGGKQIVALTTNISNIGIAYFYDIQPVSAWCSATIENKRLTITVDPNTEETGRRITITLNALDVPPVSITVTQAPFLSLEVANNTVNFEGIGGNKIVNVITDIPVNDWSALSDATWCHVEQSSDHLTITADVSPGLEERTATITVSSTLIPLQKTIIVTQGKIDTGTDFSITGYENQILDVAFYNDATTSKLALNDAGNGRLAATNSNLTIKSIKAEGSSEIFIGRKELDGDIKLAVNANHTVQWRTKAEDATTALIGTAAELLLRFNAAASVTTYEFEADIDLMDQPWVPVATLTNKTIEGEHHKIYNFNIKTRATHTGLFVTISGSTIKNLHIASGNINITGTSTSSYVGAFVGNIPSSAVAGEIIGCSNAANITTDSGCAAGICGYVSNINIKFTACANSGNINGGTGARVGGIVNSNSSIITACYNTGTITGGQYTGGVAGYFGSTTRLYATFNTGTVVSSNVDKGAVCGRYTANLVDTQIVNCFYDAASCEKEQFASLIVPFSSEKWPGATDQYWGIGNDPVTGKYWKSVGSWNEGIPTYPTLYWE
ncbi:hypothetical protein EZS27_016256 [termite gut metagenome]|uniref:BACON domain-containing protein n=1 Tax=termite gut metagenome TaxID=433724 RepID=A0A5J4RR84_9ZZZZ